MGFILAGEVKSPLLAYLMAGIKTNLMGRGKTYHEQYDPDVTLVFHALDHHAPRPFRRHAQGTFVIGVVELEEPPQDLFRFAYPLLIRSLSNLLMVVTKTRDAWETHFVTLEQGHYTIPAEDAQKENYFDRLYERYWPLASSRLIIDNDFVEDLPEELWEGDEITEQIRWAGQKLDELNLLPAPFPIQELLSPQDYRHLKRLFGIGGLSYGNLSARKDRSSFWMSASGVNKGDLRRIGRDLLLVRGYDPERRTMILSVPPGISPRRVSVDAIEHWMIYREHPEVGAIVHVHAWMEAIPSTQINYPCGTLELAQAVAERLRQAPDPARAVIGLKNHGLTITGTSMEDIFNRIEGRIVRQVPMA